MKKAIVLFFLTCLTMLPSLLWAQNLETITGKVVSASAGTPMIGATVQVKGTDRATLTNAEGAFTIKAARGAVLVISYTGAETTEFKVGSDLSPRIGLASKVGNLEDVIVVGYGTQKKSVVTGAISSVGAKDLQDMPVSRVDDALEGRVSGVTVATNGGQPGAAATVSIRGVTSINGSTPLYVVDGSIVDAGGIEVINPADIESIEVLKDAASTAIYGARGATGVILITTKKGKVGPPRVSYSGYVGTQAPSHKIKLTNAEQYATLRNESLAAAGDPIKYANPQSLGAGTNWQSVIFDNHALVDQNDLSISGGGDRGSYFTSFGYYDDQGIVTPSISNYKRFSIRLNADYKIKPWLTVGENVGFTYSHSQGSLNTNSVFGGPLSSAINLDPTSPVVVPKGSPLLNEAPYTTGLVPLAPNGLPYFSDTTVQQEITNPAAYVATQQGNHSWAYNVLGNVFLSLKPIKGLELKSVLNVKQAFYGNQSFTPLYYLNASTTNTVSNSFYRENDQTQIWSWDNTASYTRAFGDHHLMLLVGSSAQRNSGSGVNATLFNLPYNTYSQASFDWNLPTADHLGGGFENQPYSLTSLFGRFTYDYNERYLLTANFRRDGSSNFGSNNKYGYFPSASIGWVPTKEDFWKNTRTINYLKIRIGYGVNGNDNLSPFQYESTIGGGRDYPLAAGTSSQAGSSPNAPANPNLKWEQTSQLDGGFDITVARHWTASFDAYNKKTTGMLLQLQLPGYVGASGEPYGNVASLEVKGLELNANFDQHFGKVYLNVGGNVSYATNKITSIGTNQYFTAGSFQSSAYEIGRIMVGHPLDEFYGFKTNGIFQTQADVANYKSAKTGNPIQPLAQPGDFRWQDLDKDGSITSADRTFLGNPIPPVTFGFSATVAYHGFDLRLFAQGVAGNKIFEGYRRLDIATANYMSTALGRWTGPGTSNDYPRLDDADPNKNFTNPSNFYLHNGAYLKLRTLQLGYNLPKEIATRAGLQSLRIYISGDNLITFTKYNGFDPEIGGNTGLATGNANNYGVDNVIYPTARTLAVGLNVGL